MEDKVICNKSDLVNAADAVRSKLGVTDTYYVSELSSAIQSIETGGIVPSGTILITENGTVDVTQYASAEVNISSTPSLQSKSVTYTANGTATITPDEGYDALKKVDVTVNVASGGGGTCRLRINVTTPPIDNSAWYLEIHPAFSTSIDEYISLDANNLSAEIGIPNNGMFALVTTSTIDFVNTSDWGIFDDAGIGPDYVENPDIIRTYICYAGETSNGTWGIVFR